MKELAILFASVMSIGDLIKTLKEDIDKYEVDPTEDNLKKLQVACMLILSKASIDHSGGGTEGAMKVIDQIENAERASKLLSTDKN